MSGQRSAGGTYVETSRVRRVSSSDPECAIVTSMHLSFSPKGSTRRYLATIATCERSSYEREEEKEGRGRSEKQQQQQHETLQLCLLEWEDKDASNLHLIQRCTICGEGGPNSVHIFAQEIPSDPESNGIGSGIGDGPSPAATSSSRRMPTYRDEKDQNGNVAAWREKSFLSWSGTDRIIVAYGSNVWIFQHKERDGLSLLSSKNVSSNLSEKSTRSKIAARHRRRAKAESGSFTSLGSRMIPSLRHHDLPPPPHHIVGSALCQDYNLLLLLGRSGRLLVCDTTSGSVINSVEPPEDDKEPDSDFTVLAVDGSTATVGTSSGTLWSLNVQQLEWMRPLPYQKQVRRRLTGNGGDGVGVVVGNGEAIATVKGYGEDNGEVSKQYQQGWPVVSALAVRPGSGSRSGSGRNGSESGPLTEMVVAMYADHTIAVFEVGAATATTTTTARRRRSKDKKRRGGKGSSGPAHGGTVTNHAVGHFGAVRSVAWHPERTSSVLLTSSADQSIGVWQLTPIIDDLGGAKDTTMIASSGSGMRSGSMGSRSGSGSGIGAPVERRAQLVRVLDVASYVVWFG